MTKYINLTVDVEAQPLRATDSHLDRLIWGRWGSEDWGIGRMMDIADQYGVKLSFYVDYCEYYLYGDHLLDVAKEIVRRGHDAQVHLHPEFLPADLPGSLSVNWNRSLNSFDQAAAPSFAAHFTSMAERAAGRPPLAYRGGAFRFSPALDQAFAREGLRLSSNYFSRAKYWSAPKPHAKFFSWPSGMFELPLSTVHVHGRHRHLIFEDYPVHDVASLAAFAEAFDRLPGEIGILNLLLHSWSFLRRDMEGRYVGPDEQKIDRFHKLLDGIAQLHMRAVTTSECIEIAEAAPPQVIQYPVVFSSIKADVDCLAHSVSLESLASDDINSSEPKSRERNSVVPSKWLQPEDFIGRRWSENIKHLLALTAEHRGDAPLISSFFRLSSLSYLADEVKAVGAAASKVVMEQFAVGEIAITNDGGLTTSAGDFSWHRTGLEDRSQLLMLQQWAFVRECARAHIDGKVGDALKIAIPLVKSWCERYLQPQSIGATDDLAWHDHATALRVRRALQLIYMLEQQGIALGEAFPNLSDFCWAHLGALASSSFYQKGTNHGFDQALSLYLLINAVQFPSNELVTWIKSEAIRRLKYEIDVAFNAEGVHIENSPAYHAQMMGRLLDADRIHKALGGSAEDLGTTKIFRMALKYLAAALRPDGRLPAFGDTNDVVLNVSFRSHPDALLDRAFLYWISQGNEGTPSGALSTIFKDAGYAFFRNADASTPDQAIHLAFKSGFLSTYHRHDDDNSFVLWGWGEEWLIDGGIYRYHESDPLRIYVRSSLAHNIPTPIGAQVTRTLEGGGQKGRNFFAWNSSHSYSYVGARTSMFQGITFERRLIFTRPDNSISLVDRLVADASGSNEVEFRLHFPDDKDIQVFGSDALVVKSKTRDRWLLIWLDIEGSEPARIVRGERKPRMGGWRSRNIGEIEPCQTLVVRSRTERFSARSHFTFGAGEAPTWDSIMGQRTEKLAKVESLADFEGIEKSRKSAFSLSKLVEASTLDATADGLALERVSSLTHHVGARCNICGNTQFVSGPNERLSNTGLPPRCAKCHSLERHRALQVVFSRLPRAMFLTRRAIQFAPDGSVNPDWFARYEASTFGGMNSIDLQQIDRADGSFDYIGLTQVLEFVPDDKRAFSELLRIGSEDLILNVTFSSNMEALSSSHFSEPRPPFNRYHYYERDFLDHFEILKRGLVALVVTTPDPVTGSKELTHFFCKRRLDAVAILAALNSANPGSAIELGSASAHRC